MNIKQALGYARDILVAHGMEEARLECQLLLRQALGIDRVQLYLDLNRDLSPEEEERFRRLVERRLGGEPVAYIMGHREFYGLDFSVESGVLIPRPETELLAATLLYPGKQIRVHTSGTEVVHPGGGKPAKFQSPGGYPIYYLHQPLPVGEEVFVKEGNTIHTEADDIFNIIYS